MSGNMYFYFYMQYTMSFLCFRAAKEKAKAKESQKKAQRVSVVTCTFCSKWT